MEPKNQTKRKILSLSVYLAIAVVFAYLVADRNPPFLEVGAAAPLDTTITLSQGQTTTFRKLLKNPMIINFWAPWCPPCLKELPTFSKMAKKFTGKVVFLGPALTSSLEEIQALKSRFFIDYEMFPVPDDVVDEWHGRTLPTTYLIASDGTIAWARSGITTEEELEQAIKLVVKN